MSTIKVGVKNIEVNKQGDVYTSRKEFGRYYKEEAEATISVVAYNRPDVTKICVDSILRCTTNVNYKLILVYNDNAGQEEILKYFEGVPHENKLVLHIEHNIGAAFAYKQIMKHIEGKYYVSLANDVIVTPNWLRNLIICAESDDRIGMVNPVSTNVSNLQCVPLRFSSYEEMLEEGAKYNVSDPTKWEERLRLITIGTMYTRPCLDAIGSVFDVGFFHDFGDDDISFQVRRAGYKCILAGDTWVHHNHDLEARDQKKLLESISIGRRVFAEKYKGLDAWDDVNNFHKEYTATIKDCKKDTPAILGIDVKCGTPILEIKNALRKLGKTEVEMQAYVQDAKYYFDLQTVCGAENVKCGSIEALLGKDVNQKFDYIIVGNSINTYANPQELLCTLAAKLNEGGKLYVSLKNVNNLISFAYQIGYFNVADTSNALNITVEQFILEVNKLGFHIRFLQTIPYENIRISKEDMEILRDCVHKVAKNDEAEVWGRLQAERYAFEITR